MRPLVSDVRRATVTIMSDADALELQPLARADSTAQRIKSYILSNRLRPGDLLPTEAALGSTLGVSRSSIREAIKRLATLDIVEVRHGHGTFVGNLSLAPLVEGLVFRGVLSPGDELAALRQVVAVRLALDTALADSLIDAMRGTPDPELDRIVEEMERRNDNGQPFLEEDRQFHSILASKIGNPLFEQLVTAFWEVHSAVAPRLGLPTARRLADTVKAHRAILRAAEAGDVTALKAAIVDHYAPLQESLAPKPDGAPIGGA